MGKKKNKEKKGKGLEKTVAKTEKKALQRMKKDLFSRGEDDIENLIAKFQEEDRKRLQINENVTSPPSIRSGITLTAHPEKDELILFGGQYFNGSKTFMYNDMYFYNIKKNEWTLVQAPDAPPPRCSHQAVALHQGGGQIWIFGGEFASPTQSQFYHYKDLWLFHLQEKKWEQIKAIGGPSSRSGHRMVAFKKIILVFGGFHDNVRDYKYFNDIFLFCLETYKWIKLEPSGIPPAPRSGCQLAMTPEGHIIVYGGYSKERIKKDLDKGVIHNDMFLLSYETKQDSALTKWKWSQVKQSGFKPSPRCGFSMINISNNHSLLFGGVHDVEEDEEEIKSVFFNDLYQLDLTQRHWYSVDLRSRKSDKKPSRKKKKMNLKENDCENNEANLASSESEEEKKISSDVEKKLQIIESGEKLEPITFDDGIFKVSVAPQEELVGQQASSSCNILSVERTFKPLKRMNAHLAFKNGFLYLYGGLYEDGDREVTLSDFYCLDCHKMDEWGVIIEMSSESQEWIDSSESSDEENENEAGACGGKTIEDDGQVMESEDENE